MHNVFQYLLLLALTIVLNTKKGKTQSPGQPFYVNDTNYVKLIDKDRLMNLVTASDKKVTLTIIYTNLCGGTKHVLEMVNELRATYKDSIQILLCNSSRYQDTKEMEGILKKYGIQENPVYMISSEKYRDKKSDDRHKGKLFRDDICAECRKDYIGVPYKILFDQKGNVIRCGFLDRMDTPAVKEYIEKYIR